MLPPHCYVCDLDGADVPGSVSGHFTLVCFGETEDAKMADVRAMASQGRAGHPRNAIWFCNEHVALARRHENMSTVAALDAIDTLIGREPWRTRRADTASPGG